MSGVRKWLVGLVGLLALVHLSGCSWFFIDRAPARDKWKGRETNRSSCTSRPIAPVFDSIGGAVFLIEAIGLSYRLSSGKASGNGEAIGAGVSAGLMAAFTASAVDGFESTKGCRDFETFLASRELDAEPAPETSTAENDEAPETAEVDDTKAEETTESTQSKEKAIDQDDRLAACVSETKCVMNEDCLSEAVCIADAHRCIRFSCVGRASADLARGLESAAKTIADKMKPAEESGSAATQKGDDAEGDKEGEGEQEGGEAASDDEKSDGETSGEEEESDESGEDVSEASE